MASSPAREVLNDQGAGGYFTALPLVAEAMRGSWTIRLYADPKAEPLASTTFLVEDFEPERLAFEISAPDAAPIAADEVTPINVAAKYLYGATAPGPRRRGRCDRPSVDRRSPDFPGYTFGRARRHASRPTASRSASSAPPMKTAMPSPR